MNNYKLDAENIYTLKLSSDAYYYITQGEDMLDDANLKEVEELTKRFPFGFEPVIDSFEADEQTGIISINVMPYILNEAFDMFWQATKYFQYRALWVDDMHIKVWRYNSKLNTSDEVGILPIKINAYNKKYFSITPSFGKQETILFLDGFVLNK